MSTTEPLVTGDPGADPGGPDAILDGLDPEQRAAAVALDGPVCLLAGAGTGKTRAITHRIAYGVLSGSWTAQSVLAVTFTTRAAGQMRTRLRELGVPGVQARTFHSAALRQAKYFWPQVYRSELPPIIESKLGLIGEAASRCRVRADTGGRRDLAGEIEWAKVSNVRPDDYVSVAGQTGREVAGYDLATVAHVFAAYEEVRRERARIDLEDVLLCTVALLADQPRVAAAVHSQYRHFVVDEYQDVSPVQQTLLDLWLGERTDLCVVGDPNQTIYSFAGASPSYLLDFTHRHPEAQVVRLIRDYRSTPQVVRTANAVSAGARRIDAGAADRLILQGQRDDGPEPTFTEYADEVAEAEAIARQVERLRDRGVPLREIACLFRVNAQSQAFEQALGDRGIPSLVRGAERFFDRPEVRQAVVLLRGSTRAGEMSGEGLGADVRAILGSAGWSPEPPRGTGAQRERWESLAAIVGLADDLVRERPGASLAEFGSILEERMAAQHAPVADAVTLATLHAAKGLEWDAVFLAGICEGTVPITYAQTPRQIEEERRLLYVGVTRARVELAVSWSLARTPGGRGRRVPSRFLDGVRPADAAHASEGGSQGGSRGRRKRSSRTVAACRSCGKPLRAAAERKVGRCEECPPDVDEQLFERLRAWRLDRAKAEGVPAFCVFTDATLTAVAETRPGDRQALAAIPGIGAAKLGRYGDEVVALCAGTSGGPPPESGESAAESGQSSTADQLWTSAESRG